MTVELIEFLLGLYFIGSSIKIVKTVGSPSWSKTVDVFRLVFGLIVFLIALYHGVKI